jgi:C1A family cysteine protease
MDHPKLNYQFQNKDVRDFKYLKIIAPKFLSKLPSQFSLQNKIGIILDQGNIGSCVSNAFALCINMLTNKNVRISRLFHYYCGRAIGGDSSILDTGLNIRTAATIIRKYGACAEQSWPYVTTNYSELPPLGVFKSSKLFKQYYYTFVTQDLISLKSCLFLSRSPIIFGFYTYGSFYNSKRGVIPTPNVLTEKVQGGHCMLIIGYNDATQRFTCANSWGSSWGDRGLCYIPYAYLLNSNLAADFCQLNFIF